MANNQLIMAKITLKGNPINTIGDLPKTGSSVDNFTLVKSDLSEVSLQDYKGKKVILNIFPSVDTSTCATSVREFNKKATSTANTVVLGVSQDLPFAHQRFCAAEGIDNVEALSAFRNPEFSEKLGVKIVDGPLAGLTARSIIVLDEQGKVIYTELVPETVDEPDYDSALNAVK